MLEAVLLPLAIGTTNNIAEAHVPPTMSISQMQKLPASERVLVKSCDSCGNTLPLEARTCRFCGDKLGYNRLQSNVKRPTFRPRPKPVAPVYGPPRVKPTATESNKPEVQLHEVSMVNKRLVYGPPRPTDDTTVTQPNRPVKSKVVTPRPRPIPRPRPAYAPPRNITKDTTVHPNRPTGTVVRSANPVLRRNTYNPNPSLRSRVNTHPGQYNNGRRHYTPANRRHVSGRYTRPVPRYGRPTPSYNRPATRYGKPTPSYNKPAPRYTKPKVTKGKHNQNYYGRSKKR